VEHRGRTPGGVIARVMQCILALTSAIWPNDHTGQPVLRSLRQLAQMARRVHVQGFRAGPDADCDILRQRDLRDTRNGFDTLRITRGPALLAGRTHP